jgi:hypothetical protein
MVSWANKKCSGKHRMECSSGTYEIRFSRKDERRNEKLGTGRGEISKRKVIEVGLDRWRDGIIHGKSYIFRQV